MHPRNPGCCGRAGLERPGRTGAAGPDWSGRAGLERPTGPADPKVQASLLLGCSQRSQQGALPVLKLRPGASLLLGCSQRSQQGALPVLKLRPGASLLLGCSQRSQQGALPVLKLRPGASLLLGCSQRSQQGAMPVPAGCPHPSSKADRVDFAACTGVKSTRNLKATWARSFRVDFAACTGVKSTRNPGAETKDQSPNSSQRRGPSPQSPAAKEKRPKVALFKVV